MTRLSPRRRRKELRLEELEERLEEPEEPGAVVEVHLGPEEGVSRALKGEWESEWSVVIHTFGIAMQVCKFAHCLLGQSAMAKYAYCIIGS